MAGKRIAAMSGRADDLYIGHTYRDGEVPRYEPSLPWLSRQATTERIDRILASVGKARVSVKEMDAAMEGGTASRVEKMAAKLIASWEGKLKN